VATSQVSNIGRWGAGTIDTMRVCARSDCSAPAAAILTYDRVAQTAYLYTVDDPTTRTPGDLCERHLRRLVLPRSWCLDDRRETATQVDISGAEPQPARKRAPKAARKPARKSARTSQSEKKLRAVPAPHRKWADVGASLFDTADVAEIEEIDEPPAAPEADVADAVWMPRFGPDTELDEVLDANTPLLRRAFGGS
jgi:Protein of unknown function (DUF3499)